MRRRCNVLKVSLHGRGVLAAVVLASFALCIHQSAQAAASRPATPPDEARVAAIAAALPETPGGATGFAPATPAVIRAAEKLLSKPIPDVPDALYLEFTQNGNRTHYQTAREVRFKAFGKLVSAECTEGKGRFIAKIGDYLEAIATQRSWVLPAHDRNLGNFYGTNLTIDLVSSATAKMLAETLVALKGRLPETSVRRTMDELDRRVFSLYRADWAAPKPKHGWFFGSNNWNPVCHCGVVCAALLVLPDRLDRARFVEAAMRAQPAFLSGFTPDGYCSEGMGYWNYGFGNYLTLGETIRKATGGKFDLFAEGGAIARAAAEYPFAYQLQDGISPHFADGGGNPAEVNLAKCRRIWPGVGVAASLPVRSTFPVAQVFISRAGGNRPFSAAVKGGHNGEHHNHNDVGTWTLMLDGEELAGDPGGEVYTARTFSARRYESKVLNSFGHPVPRVGGTLQPKGRQYRAKVLKTSFADDRDEVVLDISGAYPVPGIKRLERTVSFDRQARAFTVRDDAEFASPTEFDVPIITYCAVAKGATPETLTLTTPKGTKAEVRIAVQGGEWTLQDEVIENPGKRSPRRLAVAFRRPVVRASVAFTIKEEK